MKLPSLRKKPFVSVVSLSGVIAANIRGGGLSIDSVGPLLVRAFKAKGAKAVALRINSPGGSPVQSSLIGGAIRRLADETELPVHAFVEDVAASGGYWIATAADDIWVDDSSITGSIGVISAGFGFVDALGKLGVERRVHTAGEDKSILDPFRPERAEDVARLKQLQAKIHDAFKHQVRTRRGARLVEDRDLFTGEIFVGDEGVAAGLVDGVAHMAPKLKELYGEDIRFRVLARRRPLLARLMPGIAAEAAEAASHVVREHAMRARYGL
ncbi:S49 family peptidase [Jannaschia sp. LMIT008]|uniref:S49 family peptidase n=1 Tax=Jannaschia maritima TaxID=3032585 RepID=UPI0028120142|nr:S49 family peptidase [Jannaschia sp. LMIT008]